MINKHLDFEKVNLSILYDIFHFCCPQWQLGPIKLEKINYFILYFEEKFCIIIYTCTAQDLQEGSERTGYSPVENNWI